MEIIELKNIAIKANIWFSNIQGGDKIFVKPELLNETFIRYFYYLCNNDGIIKDVKSSNIFIQIENNEQPKIKERKYKKKKNMKQKHLTDPMLKSRIEEFLNGK